MKLVRGNSIPFVPASHENPDNPGCLKRVLVCRDDLIEGQVQMVNWSLLPFGSSFQRHYHQDMQEVFVIIEGHVQMQVDTHTHELNPGDAILIEPNEVHNMTNLGDRDATYLVFGISKQLGGKTIQVLES
jgi:quercetin dioxygenase-like cupin family protein